LATAQREKKKNLPNFQYPKKKINKNGTINWKKMLSWDIWEIYTHTTWMDGWMDGLYVVKMDECLDLVS
jgi:hypothetical protein